jgi:hypothetical protein
MFAVAREGKRRTPVSAYDDREWQQVFLRKNVVVVLSALSLSTSRHKPCN